MYAGVAVFIEGEKVDIGMSMSDGVYGIDFMVKHLNGEDFKSNESAKSEWDCARLISDFIIESMHKYEADHLW